MDTEQDTTARRYEAEPDREATGAPRHVGELREVVQRLHAEIGQHTERLAPVLLPDRSEEGMAHEVVPTPMSDLSGDLRSLIGDVHRAVQRVAELTGRLDL